LRRFPETLQLEIMLRDSSYQLLRC
jgi:hypothetical protein